MAGETAHTQATAVPEFDWPVGVLAGLAGAAVMAAAMVLTGGAAVLGGAIPGLYGLAPPPSPPAGVAIHLSHGAVLGVGFVALLGAAGVVTPRRVLAAGLAYGVALWLVAAALVMPLWLGAVGFPAAPPFPNLAPPSLLWHAVYGLVLGAAVAVRSREATTV